MVFNDKVYQEMDWLEKVCEPVICPLNDIMAEIPDEIVITYDMLKSYGLSAYGNVGIYKVLVDEVSYENAKNVYAAFSNLSWKDRDDITKCFEFVVEGEPEFEVGSGVIAGGVVKLVKTKTAFEDKDVNKMMGRLGREYLDRVSSRNATAKRANDIIELLGIDEAKSNRSVKKKILAIKKEFIAIMDENRWNIKDVSLSNKVGQWIALYLEYGNLAAYKNFCKIKVMTNYDEPIYSIEDEEGV